MKNIMLLFVGLLLLNSKLIAQTDVPTYKKVIITGQVAALVVKGYDGKNIENNIDALENNPLASELNVNDEVVKINFKDETAKVILKVPKDIEMVCVLAEIFDESDYKNLSDFRPVSFTGLSGGLEFKGDGYNVSLNKVSGSFQVTTYGNVSALLENLPKGEKVMIDSYLGDIKVRIPEFTDANISLSAKKGKAKLGGNLYRILPEKNTSKKIKGILNDGGAIINLHSERGKQVLLTSKLSES